MICYTYRKKYVTYLSISCSIWEIWGDSFCCSCYFDGWFLSVTPLPRPWPSRVLIGPEAHVWLRLPRSYWRLAAPLRESHGSLPQSGGVVAGTQPGCAARWALPQRQAHLCVPFTHALYHPTAGAQRRESTRAPPPSHAAPGPPLRWSARGAGQQQLSL